MALYSVVAPIHCNNTERRRQLHYQFFSCISLTDPRAEKKTLEQDPSQKNVEITKYVTATQFRERYVFDDDEFTLKHQSFARQFYSWVLVREKQHSMMNNSSRIA